MSRVYAAVQRHPLQLAVVLALIVAGAIWFGHGASANSDVGLGSFEIEPLLCGNPEAPCAAQASGPYSYYSGNDPTGVDGDDWADGGDKDGYFKLDGSGGKACYNSVVTTDSGASGATARFLCDGFGKDAGITDGTGSEQNLVSPSGKIPADKYPIKAGSLGAPKDDLSHGYYIQRAVQRTCNTANDVSSHTIITLGMERANNEGDNHWGIELDATAPTGIDSLKNNNTGSGFTLDFNRQVGDVFISVDLTKGGRSPDISIFQVTAIDPTTLEATFSQIFTPACTVTPLNLRATNNVEQQAPPWNVIACDPTVSDSAGNTCRLANGTGTASATPKCGTKQAPVGCSQVPPRDFVEVAIDLTASGVSQGCFSSVVFTSRSSPSGGGDLGTADVKDIMADALPPCSLEWEKRDDTGALQGGATFTVGTNGGSDGDGDGPYACKDANTTGDDDKNPVTVVDDSDGTTAATDLDKNAAAGQVSLPDLCPGTYQIKETVAPGGFALDDNLTRTVVVNPATPEVVVGTQDTNDCANADTNKQDFCNRLGSLEWEKRLLSGSAPHALHPGATFTVGTSGGANGDGNGPTACLDSNNTGADDNNPITVVDNSAPDADSDGGQFKINRVCMGTYTITETAVPANSGTLKDEDATRVIVVDDPNVSGGANELNPVVGSALGTPPGTDDDSRSTHGSGTCSSDECDFHNRLATLIIEKVAKDLRSGSTPSLLGGASFRICPSPIDNSVTCDNNNNPTTGGLVVQDNDANDVFSTIGGLICIAGATPGTYTVTETQAPSGYAKDSTTKTGVNTTADTCANRLATTPIDTSENVRLVNTPLGEIAITFKSLPDNNTSGTGATRAQIDCTSINEVTENGGADTTPYPGTLDDFNETFTNLAPGTYTCTIFVDP